MKAMKTAFVTATLSFACALIVPAPLFSQTFTLPDRIERLSARAKGTVNVTLDGALLQLAGQFLDSSDSDERVAKEIISKLRGIHVRNFAFAREGEYTDADLNEVRAQLKSPAWTRVIDSRDENDHMQIFLRAENSTLGGVVILAAEPLQLSIVSIDGAIDLKQLSRLSGKFGIPSVPQK
jgi:hypothetical protein